MYDWNLGLSLKIIHDPEPGLNHITYNELKILNTKTTLHVSQMIEKPEVLKIKKNWFCSIVLPVLVHSIWQYSLRQTHTQHSDVVSHHSVGHVPTPKVIRANTTLVTRSSTVLPKKVKGNVVPLIHGYMKEVSKQGCSFTVLTKKFLHLKINGRSCQVCSEIIEFTPTLWMASNMGVKRSVS